MPMKKILVIAPYAYLPWRSGGQKFIGQFLEYLGRKTALTVVSVAANDASLATQYKLLPLLKKGFSRYYDFSLVKKISTLVKEEQFDAVIWEHPYLAWLAFRVCKIGYALYFIPIISSTNDSKARAAGGGPY